jgi:hypothetical protein
MVTRIWVVVFVPAAAPVCGLTMRPEWIWLPETSPPFTLLFTMAAAPYETGCDWMIATCWLT